MSESKIFTAASLLGQVNAHSKFQKGLEGHRKFKDLGSGFSYPFGQNQAEWEGAIFARAWNAAIVWMEERGE